jgi:DtxR family Mn-dependent transcriptional regulator
VLEHVLSEDLEALIAAKLGNPTRDPHGDPIPGPDLELNEAESVSIQALAPGARGRFVRVSDSDPEMLRYLAARGISPGQPFEVVDKQPFDGPVSVRFAGEVHVLGGELTRAMRAEVAA